MGAAPPNFRAAQMVVLLMIAALLQGQTNPDAAEVLTRARARISSTMKRLPKYACIQTIDRSYFSQTSSYSRPTGEQNAPCDQMSADKRKGNKPLELVATDRLRLDVAQGEGREIHSWP
jgi:Tfp pilus assembly protein PilP